MYILKKLHVVWCNNNADVDLETCTTVFLIHIDDACILWLFQIAVQSLICQMQPPLSLTPITFPCALTWTCVHILSKLSSTHD